MKDKIEPVLDDAEKLKAVESALMPQPRSFAPPDQRGIHELVAEAKEYVDLAMGTIKIIEQRLAQFSDMQSRFYNGSKP